ncbi:hypothetical protein D3C80_1939750 [compost metagenome]
MLQLLQQHLHVSDFFIRLHPLLLNDEQAVLILVVFLEIPLRVIRWRQQWVERDGDL